MSDGLVLRGLDQAGWSPRWSPNQMCQDPKAERLCPHSAPQKGQEGQLVLADGHRDFLLETLAWLALSGLWAEGHLEAWLLVDSGDPFHSEPTGGRGLPLQLCPDYLAGGKQLHLLPLPDCSNPQERHVLNMCVLLCPLFPKASWRSCKAGKAGVPSAVPLVGELLDPSLVRGVGPRGGRGSREGGQS